MRLDIACGQRPRPGFTGVDLVGADIIADLFVFPWPIETGAVEEAVCSHFVEHIPHWRPGWAKDGWWLFWEEVQRVCTPGALVTVIHPFLKTVRAFQDPTHERFIPVETWHYLNAEWRAEQKLDHYDTTANFKMVNVQARGFGAHDPAYWDSIQDLEVLLQRQ